MNKKVSIIVGIYNSSEFLRKGLDSLRNQTWTNIEVIMMDDGSTDKSGAICDEYAEIDSRFIAIHKKNSGVCDSRNKGLEIATGDYVCLMDGDDWFATDFVEYMLSLVEKTQAKMVLSDEVFTTRDQAQNEIDYVKVWNSTDAIKSIIYPYMTLGPWNKLYSMELIRKNNIRFPEHWFGETLHFASEVAYYSGKVGVGHRRVYYYRLNNVSSGTTQYDVGCRLLSLDNGKKLLDTKFSNEKEVIYAIKWRIYVDHFNLIMNIIGSEKKIEYIKEYKVAKKYLQRNCILTFLRSEVDYKEKVKILLMALFPVQFSIWKIRRNKKGLREDIKREQEKCVNK